jgi:hypothetical protein
MSEVASRLLARVGVDIAKPVIHVHAVDGAGKSVLARALSFCRGARSTCRRAASWRWRRAAARTTGHAV